MHNITFDMAVTLAHLAVKAVKYKPDIMDTIDIDMQQHLVLASVKAFTKCFATPGSHQHIGECTPLGTTIISGFACSMLLVVFLRE